MNAKEIVKNKFWIVQDKGQNIGTISFNDEQYMLSDASGSRFFTDTNDLEKTLQTSVSWQQLEIKESKPTKEVNTFPTSTHPYNSMFDVKRKLPWILDKYNDYCLRTLRNSEYVKTIQEELKLKKKKKIKVL